jgi:hypothetical protein
MLQYHGIIRQQYLFGNILVVKQIVTDVINLFNFIRSRGLNQRQFKEFLDDVEIKYGDTVYQFSPCGDRRIRIVPP